MLSGMPLIAGRESVHCKSRGMMLGAETLCLGSIYQFAMGAQVEQRRNKTHVSIRDEKRERERQGQAHLSDISKYIFHRSGNNSGLGLRSCLKP